MDKNNDDILSKILTEEKNGTSEEAEELLNFIENLGRELSCARDKNSSILSRQKQPKSKLKINKIKRTYYVRKRLLDLLYQAEKKLREIKEEDKELKSVRVTKSKIVNIALELLLTDFVTNGKKSFLFQKLFLDNKE